MCPTSSSFSCFGGDFVKNNGQLALDFFFENRIGLNNRDCVSSQQHFEVLSTWYNNYSKIDG